MSTSQREPNWQRSCSNGTCIEVAKVDGQFLIRDSKNPDIGPLSFEEDEWTAFTEAVKGDRFRFE
jgi:Domain of unknown function (DUF397)